MRRVGLAPVLLLAVLAVGTPSCVHLGRDSRSLYEQLGERPGLERLVERFLRELAADRRVAHHFRAADIRRFREQFTIHLCELCDGPCHYTGAPMREVHRGMGVSQGAFNAVVEDLIRAMEGLHIATPTQNELLARLAPLQGDVVERRGRRRGASSPASARAEGPAVLAP